MLVYGERERNESPRETIAALDGMARRICAMAPGIERHGEIATALILAGQLLQGLADAVYDALGQDARSGPTDAATGLVMELATALQRSWDSGFAGPAGLRLDSLPALAGMDLPASIRMKRPEGYAYYALYAEAYLDAARALGPGEPLRVIGIRSIGTGLACLVAVAAGAPPPWTVRPGGHPFHRRLSLAPELAAEIGAAQTGRIAIVDEGPGLSGSSFGAVADSLEADGADPQCLEFFPSHGGDLGPRASRQHRARWARARRHLATFDDLVLQAKNPAHRLESWVADLVGEPDGPLQDISGGAWRELHFSREEAWPAAHVQQERRKFLCRAGGITWLLKFAGLGPEGAQNLTRAQALHEAGFTPQVLGLRHGFLVERWVEGARPLALLATDRPALVARVGRYLGFRATAFPARPEQGAGPGALLHMARHNTAERFGEDLALRLEPWAAALPRLAAEVRPVVTDNRMQAWEWLDCLGGRLLKTDALDHHNAHDLVGCQDIGWDVVAAGIELDLSADERAALLRTVEDETGRPLDPDLLAFLTLCYLAFQMGSCALAAESLQGWPAESARLKAASERYAGVLAELLR